MEWIASAAFGLEGLVKKDLLRLGAEQIEPMQTGGVRFHGGADAGFLANLWSRCADRILLVVGRFEARSFEELFQGITGLEWKDYIPSDAAFPVRAQCARSTLMSPSDCQSITKKAVVEALRRGHRKDVFPETGDTYQIDVSIHNDVVTVSLDSSGPALNKRGYRTWNGEAPIRETLAAAMALSAPWRPYQPLHDPCCGTGTILIESAFIALDRAPGLTREFACEKWALMKGCDVHKLRLDAKRRFEEGFKRELKISGSDIDENALELASRHIRQAGLAGRIELTKTDVRELKLKDSAGMILTNPPYGERMGDRHISQAVAKQIGQLQQRNPGWAVGAITGDRSFERAYGRRADKRRRLYNGRLECEYMIFNQLEVKHGH